MKKIFTFLFLLFSVTAFSQSTTLVISQVYGAGGNSGATLKADYVELHNISGSAISLFGYSIQYASATATGKWTGFSELPALSIPAGGYFLIQMSAEGANGASLPTPDHVANPSIAMAAANGRTALVLGLDTLIGCPTGGTVVDLVGYGTSNCHEGATACAALSSTLAGFRNNNGCTDTDVNSADFTTGAPAPRNSASPIAACGVINPSLTATPTSLSFGNITVGSASASQTYVLSGSNLQGAPGNITVTAPSSDFQVSNDNSTWGGSTTIAFSSPTLSGAAGTVYVRFTPQSVGPLSGNASNTGGGIGTSVDVALNGTGDAPVTPVLSAGTLNSFGNVCLNATAGPNSFTVNGLSLTAGDLQVGPLAGFSFSTTAGGTYAASLTLSQTGGSYAQDIYVKFTPTAMQSYDGNIAVTGGGAAGISVAASGAGANNPPSVTTGSASAITYNAATLSGTITNNGCSAVTAYGFEYSTTSGFVSGTVASSSNLSGTGYSSNLVSLQPSTTYYYKAFATNSGGTTYGVEMSFTTATPVFTATALTDFGASCVNVSSDPQSFTLTSAGLGLANVNVGPLDGYSFGTSAAGPFTATLSISQPGGAFSKDIFVVFTPTAEQSYNGNIPVSGGNAAAFSVPVSGSGEDVPPQMVTGTATEITPWSATLSGTIGFIGCSPVTTYGIEYSGISGFTPGIGTKVQSSNLSGSAYSVGLSQLAPNSTYYFRAYGINAGGISYGEEQSFTTQSLKNGLIIYGSQIPRGGSLHYSITNVKPGHYQARIIDAAGRNIFRQDVITQLDFINEWFTLPTYIGTGVYYLQLVREGFIETRNFMVR
ncbi:MAG: lamin tail domain-containing protein [Chitinophagaceae bacterium]|nr:lamin tail domain-containing protein [Chitinophagaceae bacterium]